VKALYTLLSLLLFTSSSFSQEALRKIDKARFFSDEGPLDVTITLNVKQLLRNKEKPDMQFPAHMVLQLNDSTQIAEPVRLEARGNYRRQNCNFPPLKVMFKNAASPQLSPLGSLKLVNACDISKKIYQNYVLKEYLVYKLYNLVTDKSFRVRLLRIRFIDSMSNRSPMEEYAFLIEDIKDMAARSGCVERKRNAVRTEATHREQMTRVAMFEYMIGNLDWSVPVRHNIKLIVPKEDTNDIPIAVPYDFDHSGMVNAEYALPPENIDVQSVTHRVYRGFARTMEELQAASNDFIARKQRMIEMIQNFELLPKHERKEMIEFLEGFFDVLKKPDHIKGEFIRNARKE
jgi:hypothetical protein